MSTTAFNMGAGGKLKFVKNITGSANGSSTPVGSPTLLTVDDDYKLVIMAGTKNDGSYGGFTANDLKIKSGVGIKLASSIYWGKEASTGYYAVFADVKKGAVIQCGVRYYGDLYATLACFK